MTSSLILFAALSFVHISALNEPPSIVRGPTADPTYFSVSLTLDCFANGSSDGLEYSWFLNGQALSLSSIGAVHDRTTGVLTIPGNVPEGQYQCKATNKYGTAITYITEARMIRLDADGNEATKSYSAQVGRSFMMPCDTTGAKIVPRAAYSWELVVNHQDTNVNDRILPDKRVQIDENGNLYFAYVNVGDSQQGKFYRCHLVNAQNNARELSLAYSKLVVNPEPFQETTLQSLFVSTSPVTALLGKTVTLRCFFGGRADITITWRRQDGRVISSSRFDVGITPSNSGRLTISNLQLEDAGTYVCTGSSTGLASVDKTIDLKVEAVPYFKNPGDGPANVRGTVGKSVTINCNASAVPDITQLTWMRDGLPINVNPLPAKYSLSSDQRSLTISDLCKGCGDMADLGVIQCNASNSRGYVLGQGYINVFGPTTITQIPEKIPLHYPDPVLITCEATTDPDLTLTYSWTLNGRPVLDGRVNTSVPGQLSIDIAGLEDQGAIYLGEWECVASNGVSSDRKSAVLFNPAAASKAGVWPLWWIPFIVLLILLLLVLLLVLICCCLYRNRGNEYPVDEKERKGGHDPEKELKEGGFHDYQRPPDRVDGGPTLTAQGLELQPPSLAPQGSINSSFARTASDDEMSLHDYSNINTGKFTEDGSFIGQYNPGSRRSRTSNARLVDSVA